MEMEEEKNTAAAEPEVPEVAMRKYKQVTCRKCGKEYSSLFKECPYCGYSHTRVVLTILGVILCVGGLITATVINSINVSKLQKDVDALKADMISTQRSIAGIAATGNTGDETVNLIELQYYNDQLINGEMKLEDLPDDYLLYALQDGCSACAEANGFVYAFLANGYPDYIPVYFITPESNETLFFDVLNCTDTPTLYRMSKAEIKETYVGVDEVYNGFDKLVTEANDNYDASVAGNAAEAEK